MAILFHIVSARRAKMINFSILSPVRGETSRDAYMSELVEKISILSPRAGRDEGGIKDACVDILISILSPRAGRDFLSEI